MADIASICSNLSTIPSNTNNTAFITMMKQIAGNPSDTVNPEDDTNSLYGSIVSMYNELVTQRASDTEIADALQKIIDLTVVAESVEATESASAELVGSELQIKVPRGADGEDGAIGLTPNYEIVYVDGFLVERFIGYSETPADLVTLVDTNLDNGTTEW